MAQNIAGYDARLGRRVLSPRSALLHVTPSGANKHTLFIPYGQDADSKPAGTAAQCPQCEQQYSEQAAQRALRRTRPPSDGRRCNVQAKQAIVLPLLTVSCGEDSQYWGSGPIFENWGQPAMVRTCKQAE